MQEYKRLIDDVIGQLRAGFDEVVYRQQAEAARAQKKYDQDIASLQKLYLGLCGWNGNPPSIMEARRKTFIASVTDMPKLPYTASA